MSPERWAQIKALFAEAADWPVNERAARLTEVCGADEPLRAEVEKLLAADAQAATFLEAAPLAQLAVEPLAAGDNIGPYRILRELGRGGMGTVYLAERTAAGFEQQVALKLVRRGMDSEEVLRRFFAERQILAQLNHPNIARLLDGGQTAEGRPYIVMEYIAGEALDEYAATRQLDLGERLRLFREVCAAVHYAHQRLVIHRDLKPSNILVTEEGQVKLLDFGIAKVLSPTTGDAGETLTQWGLMTPAYASPEQARRAPMTTASDVYALGVILYELLTGRRPYDVKPERPDEWLKTICEQEPERPSLCIKGMRDEGGRRKEEHRRLASSSRPHPSSLIPHPSALKGDLDNIVLMALRKDPQRRYASVEQFSEDLHRYLAGLPVLARPDTLRYRAAKFVQRNRALTTAAVLAVLILLGGSFATWRQARIAERERAAAQRRFGEVRELANRFLFKYHDEVAKLPGSTAMREMLVSDAKEYLARLSQDASGDTALQLELARAWLKLGDVLGKPYLSNLGQTDEAITSYEQARTLAAAAQAREPQNQDARVVHGLALQSSGMAQVRLGRFDVALPVLREAVQLLEFASHDAAAQRALISAQMALADGALRSPKRGQAVIQEVIEQYRQALTHALAFAQAAPAEVRRVRPAAILHQRLGTTLPSLGTAEALQEAQTQHACSTALFEQLAQASSNDVQAQRDLVDQYQMQAQVQAQTGDIAGALAGCQKGIELFARLAAADPRNAEAQRDLATAYYITANVYQQAQRLAEGVEAMRRALAIYEALSARDPRNAENYSDLHSGYGRLSEMEAARGRTRQAAEARAKGESFNRAGK